MTNSRSLNMNKISTFHFLFSSSFFSPSSSKSCFIYGTVIFLVMMVTNNAMKYPEEPADKPKQLKTLSELNICIECLSKKHMLLHHKNESMANNESLGLSNKHWYEQVVSNKIYERDFILEHICFINAFKTLFYHQMVIVCDDTAYTRVLEANCSFSRGGGITIRTLQSNSTHKDTQKMFLDLLSKDHRFSAFTVLGTPEMISMIFEVSRRIGFSVPYYTWILPADALVYIEPFNQPKSLILLKRQGPLFGIYPLEEIYSSAFSPLNCEHKCSEFMESRDTVFTIHALNHDLGAKIVKIGSILYRNQINTNDGGDLDEGGAKFYLMESNELLTRLFPISSTSSFHNNNDKGSSESGHRKRLKVVTILDPPFTIVKSESYSETCDVGHLCLLHQPVEPHHTSSSTTTEGKESNRKQGETETLETNSTSPFSNTNQNHTTTTLKPMCCVGYCIDLLRLIKYDMNFDVDLYVVEDGVYGDKINETWVGMVGDLVNTKADLVLAALTINAQRAEVIDYTASYMVGGVAIATMVQTTKVSFVNLEAFKPLSWEMWMITLAMMLVTSVMLLATEHIVELSKSFMKMPINDTTEKWSDKTSEAFRVHPRKRETYTFRQSSLYIGGLAFQRDIGGEQPVYLGSRLIAIVIAASLLVIMTSYTAVLTANKVTHKTALPISGFKDYKILNPTSSFTFGTIANSAFTRMFRESSDANWNRMYQFMKPYNFKDTDQAVEDLKAGKLNAIIHDYPVLFHYLSKDLECRIKIAGEAIKDAGYGLAVKKGNPLRDQLSELIMKYQDQDTLAILKDRWMNTKCEDSTTGEGGAAGVSQLDVNFFGGLFLVVAAGILTSLLVLKLEHIHESYTTSILSLRVKQRTSSTDKEVAILHNLTVPNTVSKQTKTLGEVISSNGEKPKASPTTPVTFGLSKSFMTDGAMNNLGFQSDIDRKTFLREILQKREQLKPIPRCKIKAINGLLPGD